MFEVAMKCRSKVINFINIIVAHLLLAIYLNPPKTMGTRGKTTLLKFLKILVWKQPF